MPVGFSPDRGRGELQEAVEEELDAEVVRGGAEEGGGEVPGENFLQVEIGTGSLEEFQFLADLGVGDFIDGVLDGLGPRFPRR